ASYTLTRNMMAQGALPPAEAVRTEEFVNAFDYGHVAPSHRTFRIYTELAPSPFGRGHQMLKIGIKGRRLGREEQRPAVLTFLVDTSGSMNAPERIGLVRKSLKLLVENLAPRDRVAVIQYDSHARLLLEHTPASNKAQILQAIDRMQCSGSTNLEEGMEEAYRLAAAAFIGGAENRVLLLSDGVANLGSIAAEDILDKVVTYRKQGIFCSVFGVGSGSYDDTMLETLANKGDGVYTFLDSEEQARRVFVDDLAATLNTIASDVKIQVEFNSMVVSQYRQLGYENRRLKKEDFRNDAVDAGEVGSGQAVTALYELSLLPQLLAKTRIDLPPRKLATVRVRYRRIDTGRVEEIEKAVWPRECLPVLERASHGFRLAAGVAEFAEILRGSPHAKGSAYEDVADVLRPVALELHLDRRVQELLQMVIAAESTPRGE
ncbi:MAG: von Willebrand factor type A domain-containing protein, partial [Kiritimatiellia bacterium]|nr:von Willebrand factor type A domain-containing protein [Kiritimatiellia bacterium]